MNPTHELPAVETEQPPVSVPVPASTIAQVPVPAAVKHVGQVAVASPAVGQPPVDAEPQPDAAAALATEELKQQPAPDLELAPVRDIPSASINPVQANGGPKVPLPTSAIPAILIGLLVAVLLIAIAGYAFL